MAKKNGAYSKIPRRRTQKIVKKIVDQLKKDKIELEAVILFGSQVGNYSHEESDIDLCIVVPNFSETVFQKKKFEAIHSANKSRENIDVIVTTKIEYQTNMISPILHEIRKNGLLIFGNKLNPVM